MERKPGKLAQQQVRRGGKGGQQTFHFLFPAARHQSDASRFGQDMADVFIINQIYKRIAHIFHRHAV